jgi:glycosyltransferase involved in cell wall biosynthesis
VSDEPAVLLLGRRDQPTDGVADYCEKLRAAGIARGVPFEIAQMQWAEKGWTAALASVGQAARAWRDRWVFLQYTTLAWSSRGFPLRTPGVLDVLKKFGARPAVVFHDFLPARGSGIVGGIRAHTQLSVLRGLYARASLAIFTVPVEKLAWIPPQHQKAAFIPVGSNFPEIPLEATNDTATSLAVFTVAVFGITGGPAGANEVADIVYALRGVQSKGVRVRLVAIGRGSEVFESELRSGLSGSGIELSMLGLMSADELVRVLAGAHALLCVRGHVSSRRGSAIAGLVCGVPIVGYRGEETGFPITEAGVKLVDQRDRDGLVRDLCQVLTDEDLRQEMRQRSFQAAKRYFGWDAIASRFSEEMAARPL